MRVATVRAALTAATTVLRACAVDTTACLHLHSVKVIIKVIEVIILFAVTLAAAAAPPVREDGITLAAEDHQRHDDAEGEDGEETGDRHDGGEGVWVDGRRVGDIVAQHVRLHHELVACERRAVVVGVGAVVFVGAAEVERSAPQLLVGGFLARYHVVGVVEGEGDFWSATAAAAIVVVIVVTSGRCCCVVVVALPSLTVHVVGASPMLQHHCSITGLVGWLAGCRLLFRE